MIKKSPFRRGNRVRVAGSDASLGDSKRRVRLPGTRPRRERSDGADAVLKTDDP